MHSSLAIFLISLFLFPNILTADGLKVEDLSDPKLAFEAGKLDASFSGMDKDLQKELLENLKKVKDNFKQMDSFMKELDGIK